MKAMTAFGKKLVALRNKAISNGMTLMTEEEIENIITWKEADKLASNALKNAEKQREDYDLALWERLKKAEDNAIEEWKKMTTEPIRKWMFYAENENGDGRYLQDGYFIGTYSDACAFADIRGDVWEGKTGGLIMKLTIESHGKVKE
jgi:hypothetical protein